MHVSRSLLWLRYRAGSLFFIHVHLCDGKLPLDSRGSLAIMSSFAGKSGIPYVAPYSAAKHALHGFADSVCVCVSVCVDMLLSRW